MGESEKSAPQPSHFPVCHGRKEPAGYSGLKKCYGIGLVHGGFHPLELYRIVWELPD